MSVFLEKPEVPVSFALRFQLVTRPREAEKHGQKDLDKNLGAVPVHLVDRWESILCRHLTPVFVYQFYL